MQPRLLLASILLYLCLLILPAAQPLSAQTEQDDQETLATIAMLEDTRCPDGLRVANYLRDFPPTVRRRAARALSRLQDSTVVEYLAERLQHDDDVEVRREAAFALGQIGSAKGLPALEHAFDNDSDIEVKALAVEATGKIVDPRSADLAIRALTNADSRVRSEAAVALWRLGEERALLPLVSAVEDSDPEVRWRVVYALEKIEMPAEIRRALEPLATDESAEVRARVARTLGRQKSSLALPVLFQLLEDQNARVRINSARAIGEIGDSSAVPQLLVPLEDENPHVREVTVTALGQLGDDVAVLRVQELAEDPVPAVRAASALVISQLLPPDAATPLLMPLLEDPSEFVRAFAIQGLAQAGAASSIEVLTEILRGQNRRGEASGGRERAAAATALGVLKSKAARAELFFSLEDFEPAVVASAANALAEIGANDPETIQALIDLVRNNPSPNEPDIAIGALEALAKLESREAVPVAIETLASTQVQIRAAALDLLIEVQGDSVAHELAQKHRPPDWKPSATTPYREPPPSARRTVIATSKGDLVLQLFSRESPLTVKNFLTLAEAGYFDGVRYHRVVPNFVIQDGDPTGTGWGGPGYAIRCEYNRKKYEVGTMGMALAGKDTGGSQYFITHAPQPHLNGRYTVFGQMVDGFDVLEKINVDDVVLKITIED